MDDLKLCRVCGQTKSVGDFYRAAGMADGYRGDCKACNLAAKHKRYMANPEPAKARVKQWQADNPERHLANQRRRRQRPEVKLKEREDHLRRAHGITLAEYDRLLVAQRGRCAICGALPTVGISLHVDHDHDSGAIRGLLCFRCNNALGDFGDDVARIHAALAYLRPRVRDPRPRQRLDELKELARQ